MDKLRSKEELETLVNDHWKYIEGVLIAHEVDEDFIITSAFHYKSAFHHGYKHAVEDMTNA